MNVFGNTCPMCCGDLEDVVYLSTGAAVCLSCGCNTEAMVSVPSAVRHPDADPFSAMTIAMGEPAVAQASFRGASLSQDIQIQTSAG